MENRPNPTPKEIKNYVKKWEKSPEMRKYKLQEEILDFIFKNACRSNECWDSIFLKVSTLNKFYSTNIINTRAVADHVHSIKEFGFRVRKGDLNLVDDLSKVPGIEGRAFRSFASKYCSRYNPEKFPIYDNLVRGMLISYQKKDNFHSAPFKGDDLKDYKFFCEVIRQFRKFYGLEKYTLKEIDRFLWQLGKENR
ncbi:MAG: hypothetical protein WC043_03660 [Pseudobdellovibrionaceae bacterium]|jgi:hypothetical protein